MKAAGILFADVLRSGLLQSGLPEMIGKRSMASVPFGCRYRLVDFALSCLANAGIQRVGVAASYGDRELMEHLGSGKDWDLALRAGGIRFLPPEGVGQAPFTRLTLLKGIRYAVAAATEPLIVLCDGDMVGNIDLSDMLREHQRRGAEVTVAVKQMYIPSNRQTSRSRMVCEADAGGELRDMHACHVGQSGMRLVCMHVYVIERGLLLQLIDEATVHHLSGFHQVLMLFCRGRHRMYVYRYEGFYAKIGSSAEYFAASMQLAQDSEARRTLLEMPGQPIRTRIQNSPPTIYRQHAQVRACLIADGCEIEGEVENSILFRGVHVGRGASVRNSILLRGCEVRPCASLRCVVADHDTSLGGCLSGAEALPYYIGEGVRI